MALAIHSRQNPWVQALALGMVSLVGLAALPVALVLTWLAVAAVVSAIEDRVLRRLSGGWWSPRFAGSCAAALRVLMTTLYAAAAYALIVRGGPGVRMFAFALMSTSMVHVLMRFYRSPGILLACLAPYIFILAGVGIGLTRQGLARGDLAGILAPAFTVGMFAVQFWTARAQLAGSWNELSDARRKAEERGKAAEGANAAKSQFLASMSHELRTPLNAVLGMAQALRAHRLSASQLERVKVIQRSGCNLLAILNDLLDLSRIEAGNLTLEISDFDLEHLVRGVAAAYEPQAAAKGVEFSWTLAKDARGTYRGDVSRIRRILYALCENGLKFTSIGRVALDVQRDAAGLVFRVTDTGVGIAAEHLPRLFDEFFQVDSGLSRQYTGAGAGLAICRELALLMGGAIEAASELGRGATFTVTIPLDRLAAAADSAASPQGPPEDAARLRVLAAEDNETNRLVLQTLLAMAGITPAFAVNGREAVAAWENSTWDIILMDIQMPEMSGLDAARAIRRREREAGRPPTPIIALTANAMVHHLAEYRAAGIDGVVSKPIEVSQLLTEMERSLARAPTRGETRPRAGRGAV